MASLHSSRAGGATPAPVSSPTGLSAPIVLGPDGGEWLDILGARVRILADGAATGGECVVFEEIEEPGKGPPLHRHGRDDEFFRVLSGTVKFSVNGKELVLGPGGFLAAPRGSVHTFCNAGTTPLHLLIVCTPAGLEVPFRACDRMARDGTLTMDAVAAAFKAFDLEILGPPLMASAGESGQPRSA